MRNTTTYFNAVTLFDTGAYTSFVNREVAKWLEQQQHGGTVAGAHRVKSSKHDVTSLKKVKSNTTVPYIELLNCVPAKPTSDVGTSCLLDLILCCSNHFATSLLTNDV